MTFSSRQKGVAAGDKGRRQQHPTETCGGGGDETTSRRFQRWLNEWIVSIVARQRRRLRILRTAAGPVLWRWQWMSSPRARQRISSLSRWHCSRWLRARCRCVNTKSRGEVQHDSQLLNGTIQPESGCTIVPTTNLYITSLPIECISLPQTVIYWRSLHLEIVAYIHSTHWGHLCMYIGNGQVLLDSGNLELSCSVESVSV